MTKESHSTFSKKKKITFRIFSFLLVVLLFIFIELILRMGSIGKDLNLFVKHPHPEYKDFYQVNKDIGFKYFNTFDATGATNDAFHQDKPENGYRIFVLGSSTVVGFPYNKNLMFTRILKERLNDAYPTKEIEVINTAITAINTITLNDYMKEVVKYEPDAILFYAGHNEFYGAYGIGSNETMSRRPFLQKLHFKLIKLRTYQVFQQIIKKTTRLFSKEPNIADQKGSLMKRIVKDKDIELGGDKYQVGIKQYSHNLESILQEAQSNNIDVFIGSLVSNIKDIPPFGDNEDAHSLYVNGIEAYKAQDTLLAHELLTKAKEYDPVRFRASEDINDTIKKLAIKYNCYLVDIKGAFEMASAGGIVGNNLLTEHVHPNIEGQFLMAETFYTEIIESKIIEIQATEKFLYGKNYYRTNWPYTELDSLTAVLRVNQLKSYWPFTSLDHDKTFIEKYTPKTKVDTQAYYCIIKPNINEETVHDSLAEFYLSLGDYKNASKEFDVLTKLNPSWYKYYNKAANCHLKLNNLYLAENNLNASIRLIDTYFAYLMLAEINLYKLNLNSAEQHYLKCQELAENEKEEIMALEGLYKIYSHQEDNKLDDIEKKLARIDTEVQQKSNLTFEYGDFVPDDIAPYIQKANNHYSLHQYDSALFVLHNALKINDCPLVNKKIGDILFEVKNNKLLYYYKKAYDDYKYDSGFLITYCIAFYVNKDITRAKEVLAELSQLDSENTEISKLQNLLNISIK